MKKSLLIIGFITLLNFKLYGPPNLDKTTKLQSKSTIHTAPTTHINENIARLIKETLMEKNKPLSKNPGLSPKSSLTEPSMKEAFTSSNKNIVSIDMDALKELCEKAETLENEDWFKKISENQQKMFKIYFSNLKNIINSSQKYINFIREKNPNIPPEIKKLIISIIKN